MLPSQMDTIVLESVSKKFRHRPALFNWFGQERGGETQALDRISFSVAKGSALVLLGPNGSGKSTTLKLISTMLLPDSGTVLVGGSDTKRDASAVRRQIGFAVANERSFFPRLSAWENLDFFAALDDVPRRHRRDKVGVMLDRVGLVEAANTLVMKFSSGMYQRLAVARALMTEPAVLLLDEPTRSLDPSSATRFWTLVRDLAAHGTTVVLATHSFTEAAAVGDAVGVLMEGRLAGWRRMGGLDARELRNFYFQRTGEQHEDLAMAACS
jgi:ABC-2 type transport system ATP-binding protein